jgi:2-methylcitrate dehydratase PrpD
MSHTQAILDFAAAPHVLPEAVRADALRLLADTLAVMAAGAASDEAGILLSALNTVSPELVEGRVGSARASTSSARTAGEIAFFNGFAIHCLEWDAVHEPAVVHAFSVVTAALLAASHRKGGSDPEAFLTALAIGVDIASGLGLSATGPMRFFRPATAGVIGAALAVARLEGLSGAQMADVLGLAYSFAGGTMQAHVEGSIALPLQIGRAAQAAVQAVDLVLAGMTGPHDVLEGPFGYSSLIEPLDLAQYTPTLGQVWRITEVSIKPFPSGRASHAVLNGIQDLRLRTADVRSLTAFVPPLIHRLVGRPCHDAMTAGYARLCLPFLAALMLRDGLIDPRQFTHETFADPSLQDMASRITVEHDANDDENALRPQRFLVELKDGFIDMEMPNTIGSPDSPMSPAQLAAKYAFCRELATNCDPRTFDDPLSYATDPR